MKIVLLNNNPVVNKLVTLSVQKTSDELRTAESIEAMEAGEYDLLIVDDVLYGDGVMEKIESKINFCESLYICSKDAPERGEFTKTLKKPFLPTDLVETLVSLGKMVEATEPTIQSTKEGEQEGDLDLLDDALFHDFETDETLDELDDFDALEEVDDLEMLEDASEEESYDDILLEDLKEEGVLDRDDLQEVQSLLEETEDSDDFDFEAMQGAEEELDLGDELLAIDGEQTEQDALEEEDAISFEDGEFSELELQEDSLDATGELGDEEELDFETLEMQEEAEAQDDLFVSEETQDEAEISDAQEQVQEELQDLEDFEEESFDEEAFSSKIQEAVASLSEEDLQTQIDEDILLNIGSLTSRDLKLAIGEEVQEESQTLEEEEEEAPQAAQSYSDEKVLSALPEGSVNGVEALKKLLQILSDEEIAASLKGMKININITLGDA